MSNLTNQQILDSLLTTRDEFLSSGKLMQKNIQDKLGNVVFYRSLDELNGLIAYFKAEVARESSSDARVYYYA